MARQDDWINFGINLLTQIKVRDYKMSAIIVKSGKPIAIGINSNQKVVNNNIRKLYAPQQGLHAEIAAILNVPNNVRGIDKDRFKGCELYVCGLTKAENYLLSKPCPSCQKILLNLPFKSIYYHDRSYNIRKL